VRDIEVEPYQSDISLSALIEQAVEIDLDKTARTTTQTPHSIAGTALISQVALEEAPFSVVSRAQRDGV
jgi:predicted transcriptional regulator